ncbi:MAG: 16S rRNA (cytosine(1402)-N(4))-methyltransferase RsmH [Hyphomicrobiaceae bacterium]|nr:16S rRNA (cytosine(1402)-N(4))-methyltransferase RsmH [Hyphomicrobiaceae bacterium]
MPPHLPVLLDEVLASLMPLSGKTVVDGTFGAGGYSRALLDAGARVMAIDRDPKVGPHAEILAAAFPDRFTFKPGTFSELDALADGPVDAIVLDIGVSSMQIDEAERGFSFLRDGPLDMRMSGEGPSASDLVNGLEEEDLANLLFGYGEERKSRRIAKAIVTRRAAQPISTTGELAGLIEKSIGRKPGAIHPATRSFQALRIAVNQEFDQLVLGLFAAERLLGAGGVLSVVTFHSIEDRIVKRFFSVDAGAGARSRHLPERQAEAMRWDPVARAVKPGIAETDRNPRARSAILRSARRTAAPARKVAFEGLGVPEVRMRGAA